MKNLLAVVGDGSPTPILEAALLTARRFNSHIVALGHERRDQARRVFGEFMAAHGVPIGPVAPGYNGSSASWREEDGRPNGTVGMIGRVYDLILLEQPDKLTSMAEATLEDALFASGRPVMVVPKTPRAAMGEVVAIAWNGSTETAVTVALGMPFLRMAREVVVVAVGPQHMPEPGPGGQELARALKLHGLKVSLRTASGRQRAQGESFLKEAMEAGADLLLKGAYTQSRIRQLIFGGSTRHIVMEAKIPVLIAR
jgi:nucleotide-binding universal stress UspA family protein